tara:strand:- start:443 stop:829 length:387 start_codon:yes stop_codon:yes gene_type:complete
MDEQLGGDVYLSGGARGGARKKMYKGKHCSPKESNIDGTCLDADLIHQVAKVLIKMKNSSVTVSKSQPGPPGLPAYICYCKAALENGFKISMYDDWGEKQTDIELDVNLSDLHTFFSETDRWLHLILV